MPGQYYDAETGTHYNFFRDYDSRIGRYIEADPIGLYGGLNTYAYASSSPMVHIDIFGLCHYMGYTILTTGTDFQTDHIREKITTMDPFPRPNFLKPECSWHKFLPPGKLGKTPPCKPTLEWEQWDLFGIFLRQQSRDYEEQDHLYVCDPTCGKDDGIRHIMKKVPKGKWKTDFVDLIDEEWIRRGSK